MLHKHFILISVVFVIFLQSAFAEGGISFSRNRLVFPANENAITLTVINHGNKPYLVQTGMSEEAFSYKKAPFMVTPPLFRLEGNSQNVMRIVRAGGDMPLDRESVFYFYANTIPSSSAPDSKEKNGDKVGASLSVSMRTILKVFWRPRELKMTSKEAPSLIQFRQQGDAVIINNPTPYYQSFSLIKLDGHQQDLDRGPSMVAPYSELKIPVKTKVHEVTWAVMNDYGGATDITSSYIK